MLARLGTCAGCHQARAFVHPAGLGISARVQASARRPRSYCRKAVSVHTQEMSTSQNGSRPTHLVDSVWDQAKSQTYEYPQLKENLRADVCVVGAGITGLSIAYQLSKAGKSVIVLEARSRGSGQTGRTSAQLMLWNNDYYSRLEEALGEHYSIKAARSHQAAIDFVEKVVREEDIECSFERVDGFLFPKADSDKQTLEKELAAAVRAGLTDVKMVDLGRDPAAGSIGQALLFPGCANFQPLQYINALAQAITGKYGGKIFENSRVTKMNGKHVSVKDGFTVDADHVVLATSSPIHHNLTVHSRQEPFRTYLVGMRIPKEGFKQGQYWDTDEPYHYVRAVEHDGDLVLLVGGENHKTGIKPHEYEDKYAKLEQWARGRWPEAGEVMYRWVGQVYEPIDYLALYGKDPLNDFQLGGTHYVATGDSGQSMTGSALAAMILSDEILGRANPYAEIYSPARVPPAHMKSMAELAEYFTTVAKALTEVVNPLYQTDIEDIVPGCGAVVQKGLEKVAVYKDEKGEAHAFRAVCPHLGCLVQWNPTQSTFDCPCHGSYFDKFGRVVHGPAKADLTPVELKTFGVKSLA